MQIVERITFKELSIKFLQKYKMELFSCLIIFIYLLPYFILGKDVCVPIQDTLDSNVVIMIALVRSGQIFGSLDSNVESIMNGIPRNNFGTEFFFPLWLFYLFPPFIAFVINEILIRYIAFGSMLVFLRNFKDLNKNQLLIIGCSLCFALLPFWTPSGISIAAQPLLLKSFLKFKEKTHTKADWLTIILVPFYSNFVYMLFFMMFVCIIFFFDLIKKRMINWTFVISIILIIVIYLAIEYRMVYMMFFNKNYVSHRVEFTYSHYSDIDDIKYTILLLLFGQYHAASIHQIFLSMALMFALVIIFVSKFKMIKSKKKIGLEKDEKTILTYLLIVMVIAAFYGLYHSIFFESYKMAIPLLLTFQFDRFYFLYPLFWSIIFYGSLIICVKIKYKIEIGKYVSIILIVGQIFLLFLNNIPYYCIAKKNHIDFIADQKNIYFTPGSYIFTIQNHTFENPNANMNPNNFTYRQYYSEELFLRIKSDLNEDLSSFRVICIGLNPAIAQYNGFYTLDGYFPNYPLEYKHQFRQIIARELEKSAVWSYYFDTWGSRCYTFVAELGGFENQKERMCGLFNVELNLTVFKEMGGKYVLSAAEIFNTARSGLVLVNKYEDNISAWRIFVYALI